MVFGVFAARKDSPIEILKSAREDMVNQYIKFQSDKLVFSEARISNYFEEEVSNLLDEDGIKGLELFLSEVCGMDKSPTWLNLN